MGVLAVVGIFVELLTFPRGAAINEKNLQVDDDKATVVVKAEITGEMYVVVVFLSQLITILSS